MPEGRLLQIAVFALGLAAAVLALALRAAEARRPDPASIAAPSSLTHLAVGLLAWPALVIAVTAILYTGGLWAGTTAMAATALVLLRGHALPGLMPFYRGQTPLAAAALAVTVGQGIVLLNQFERALLQ